MTVLLGIRTGPTHTGLILRDGDRLIDAATVTRKPKETDYGYTGRIAHRAAALRRQLPAAVIVVEGLKPGERGARLRRQHDQHQAVLDRVLGLLGEVEWVAWATDTSKVPDTLDGRRPARLSPNEHPKGSRDPEQAAWRATTRHLAQPRSPAPSGQVTPTVDRSGTLSPTRRSSGEERDGPGGGVGEAAPAGSRAPLPAPQPAPEVAPGDLDTIDLYEVRPGEYDLAPIPTHPGSEVEPLTPAEQARDAAIRATIQRRDRFAALLGRLDDLDTAAAQAERPLRSAEARAFAIVLARVVDREARRTPHGRRPLPLIVYSHHVANAASPWWRARVRVGRGRFRTIPKRVRYWRRLPDGRSVLHLCRLVRLVEPARTVAWATLTAAAALTVAGVVWVGWWVLTHPGEVITAALVLALLVVALLRYRQPT